MINLKLTVAHMQYAVTEGASSDICGTHLVPKHIQLWPPVRPKIASFAAAYSKFVYQTRSHQKF